MELDDELTILDYQIAPQTVIFLDTLNQELQEEAN